MKENILDVVIIGGGVAGSTVALYLARAGHKPTIITNDDIGGKLNDIDTIQNYVGIKDASGEEVAENIMEQLLQSGLEEDKDILTYTNVLELNRYNSDLWEILIGDSYLTSNKIFARNVVIATGMEKLKLKQVDSNLQHNCVLCDGFMYKDKSVIVVGGGSSAFTEAIELSKLCSSVNILSRTSEYRAEKFLVDEVMKSKNISIIHGEIKDAKTLDDTVSCGVRITEGEYKDTDVTLIVHGLFTYIGSKPNNGFLPRHILKDEFGHIVRRGNNAIDEYGVVENMYVVGDITTITAKQFGIAIGQATLTATELIEKL